MRVIPPLTITAAMLTSSTVAEPAPGEVVYDGSATYLAGQEVISTTTHKKYTSLRGVSSTVLLSVGTPCIATWPKHGLVTGDSVYFTTTGTLPTGIVANTTYFVTTTGSDTFTLSATAGGAAIASTGTSTGTHTAFHDVNKGNALPDPDTANNWWIVSGVPNKWNMFDLVRNSQTTGTSPMTVVVTPQQRINSIAVLGMDADTVTINVTSGGVTVYTVTKNLQIRRVNDGYDYFFEPFSYASSFVVFNVPPYTNMVVTVTLTKATGPVGCGSLVLGTSVFLGVSEQSAESDSLNFSTIERDEFGNTTLVQRRTVPKTRQTLLTPNARLGKLLDVRETLNAVPAVWSALDDGSSDLFEPLLILGVYKQFTINLAYATDALVTLELEEI